MCGLQSVEAYCWCMALSWKNLACNQNNHWSGILGIKNGGMDIELLPVIDNNACVWLKRCCPGVESLFSLRAVSLLNTHTGSFFSAFLLGQRVE